MKREKPDNRKRTNQDHGSRDERLAEQLRANLKRRKQQVRRRAEATAARSAGSDTD